MGLIAKALRLVSLVACGVVIVSFAYFATEYAGQASDAQREKIADSLEPNPVSESRREREGSGFREAVDDANDVLLAPFVPFVEGSNIWIQRGVSGLAGLLVYGLGLGLIANFVRK